MQLNNEYAYMIWITWVMCEVWCIYNFMEVIVWFVFMQPANNIALNHEFMNEKE